MDNYDYLNQIAQDNRPVKTSIKVGNLDLSLIIKIIAGGIVAFIALMLIGNLINTSKVDPNTLTRQLYTRTVNINKVNTDNVRYIKSSRLRSISAALTGSMTNMQVQLGAYLQGGTNDQTLLALTEEAELAEENDVLTKLETNLLNARLNGVMDRAYANYMDLNVSLIMAMTSNLRERTEDETLINILDTYYSSLSTVHQNFEDYFNPAD